MHKRTLQEIKPFYDAYPNYVVVYELTPAIGRFLLDDYLEYTLDDQAVVGRGMRLTPMGFKYLTQFDAEFENISAIVQTKHYSFADTDKPRLCPTCKQLLPISAYRKSKEGRIISPCYKCTLEKNAEYARKSRANKKLKEQG